MKSKLTAGVLAGIAVFLAVGKGVVSLMGGDVEDEIESVCRKWMIAEDGEIILQRFRGPHRTWRREMWVEPLFRRWGFLSPQSALSFVSVFEGSALEQTRTYDDTWAMNSPLSCAGKRFSAVMVGWSIRDAFAACRALTSGNATMADSETFRLFYPTMIGGMFEHLVAIRDGRAYSG